MKVGKHKNQAGPLYTASYKDGLFHCEDGPAVIWHDGGKEWYQDGLLHREGDPARIWANDSKEWFRNGRRHREDGPAIEYTNGTKRWFIFNKEFSEEEFSRWLDKKNLNEKLRSTLPTRHHEKKIKI